MKCLVCNSRNAVKDPTYGVIPCLECQQKQRMKISKSIEFTSSEIKEQRKQYADHLIQPFYKGELSKEYIEKYGTKNIKVTDAEVKKAKKVWRDESYYS